MKHRFRLCGTTVDCDIARPMSSAVVVACEDRTESFDAVNLGPLWTLQSGDKRFRIRTVRDKDRYFVWLNGTTYELEEVAEHAGGGPLEPFAGNEVRAPMPGAVIMLLVSAGDDVQANQVVAVIEAMKMEHNLRVPRAGKIARVDVKIGTAVAAGSTVVVMEES